MAFRLHIWPRYVLESCGRRIELPPLQGAILSRMRLNRSVSYEELTDSLYGDREDGGPMNPKNVIAVTMCRLRKRILGTSLSIKKEREGEFRLVEKLTSTLDGIADTVLDD